MMQRRRQLLWGGVGVALVLVALLAFRPRAERVDVFAVGRGPLETTIDADAVTRVRDRFVITAPVAGLLHRIELETGDAVSARGVVARISALPQDPQLRAQLHAHVAAAVAGAQEAEARVEQAAQALAQAERSTARMQAVAQEGSISRDALERALMDVEHARRNHEAASARARVMAAEVTAARAALAGLNGATPSQSTVRSPVDGKVLQLFERSERVVAAGTPLLVVGDPARMEIVIDVLSSEAVLIESGQQFRLYDWGGTGLLRGTIRRVEPSGFTRVSALGVEEQRVNVIGELADRPSALGDGFRAQAAIVTWTSPDVLKVPVTALVRVGSDWQVFVVKDGRARDRQVTIGRRGAADAEVLSGLAAGEMVIVFPSERVTAGSRVRASR